MKSLKVQAIICYLLIVVGLFFLGYAIGRYLGTGYQLSAVPVLNTLIFGLLWPMLAVRKLIALRKSSVENAQ